MKKKRIVKLEPQTVELFAEVLSKLRPPPPLTVSQWADRYRVLSAESSAEPGRWHTEKAPYQRAIMDAIGDPHVRSVVVMSAAQIGKTDAFILNPLGYYMDYAPCPVMCMQPTLDMGQTLSKDRIAPMIRDTPRLTGLVDTKSRYAGNGALFVNSIAVPGTFDDAPEFVRNRAVVAPATTEGFVNNTDPAGKPDKNDGGNDMEFKNADELRNGCPDLVKEIVDEAHAEAQKQERDRLAAIDEIADAVPSDLVAEAKYGDKACSAEQLAYRAALDAKKKGHKLLDDTEDDADTSGANSVGGAAPDGVSGTGTKNKNQTDAEKRAMVKNLFHPKKED